MFQSEIEQLLSASEHHVRSWVENLEPLASKERQARSATRFTPAEVLFLAVVSKLHDAGVTWKHLAPISQPLFQMLRKPQSIGKTDVLVLWKTTKGWQFVGTPDPACVIVQVPVWDAREIVKRKMDDEVVHVQRDLNLGVAALRRPDRVGAR